MIYDITPPLQETIAVWPGDLKLHRIPKLDLKNGDNITLSGIQSTVHLGAHADAPCHFDPQGKSIGECDLNPYLGPCQVIRCCMNGDNQINVGHLKSPIVAPRVLFFTGTFSDHNKWHNNFAYLSTDIIEYLHRYKVQLVGIDTPSVDHFDSKSLPVHQATAKYNMSILEGLNLSEVPEGTYELIALPLRLIGFDASPVRAILRCS